jgi:small subunit ribosomal protein S9
VPDVRQSSIAFRSRRACRCQAAAPAPAAPAAADAGADVAAPRQPRSPKRPLREQQLDKFGRAYATGRRKDAVARVWLKPGTGKITSTAATRKSISPVPTLRLVINQVFDIAERRGQYDVVARSRRRPSGPGRRGPPRHRQALTRYEPALRTRSSATASSPAIRASSSARSTAAPRPAVASSSRSAKRPLPSEQKSGRTIRAAFSLCALG